MSVLQVVGTLLAVPISLESGVRLYRLLRHRTGDDEG